MSKKSYRQFCAVARALDVIGERWTLLLIRDLFPGPLSYSALLEGLPGLTTNLLATRLKALSERGLIEAVAPQTGSGDRGRYQLTATGQALGPVLAALSDWGRENGAAPAADATINSRWILILFGRHYRPGKNRWLVQLNCDGRPFQFRLGTAEYESIEGEPWSPDLTISASSAALNALIFGDEQPAELIDDGRIALQGEEAAWLDFLDSFELQCEPGSPE